MSPILGIIASQNYPRVTASYDSIATLSGNGSSSQLTFSSIPNTYTHLQIRLIVRGTRALATEQLYVRLNGDGGSNYFFHFLYGDGSGAAAGGSSSTVILLNEMPAGNETASVFSTSVVDVLDYTNSNKNTTLRSLSGYNNNGNTANYNDKVWFASGLWINTAAVTSVTVLSNGPFATGSSVALYGIKG